MQSQRRIKPCFSEIDRGLNHLLECELAVALLRMNQTCDGAGHPGRLMGEVGFGLIDRPILLQEHIAGRRGGRCLSVVDKNLLIRLGQMDQHEATTTDVAGPGQRDRQGKARRHRCINGVAALLEHVEADVTGELFGAHHHACLAIGGKVAVLVVDDRRICCRHGWQATLRGN